MGSQWVFVAMDEETQVGTCLVRMVRFCRSTCGGQMCLGSGSPFARQAHGGNDVVVHPRIGGAHLDQDSANHGRTDSTSTTATSRGRSGRRWISRNSSSCAGAVKLLHLLPRITSRATIQRARDRQTDSAEELQPARSIGQDRIRPNGNSARRLSRRRTRTSQITAAQVSKFGRTSPCPGESASTVAPSEPARIMAHS